MADSIADKLRQVRENHAQQLLDLSDPAKRKLSYSIGGRSVSWTEYRRFLREELNSLTEDIAALDPDGPDWVVTALR